MKIQTFSIVVGGSKCNATCPYCVSKMTGNEGLCEEQEEINVRNFRKACSFAKMSGVSTVLLTGKGETLLYPELITLYLSILEDYDFPFIELQTNGIQLPLIPLEQFERWYNLGLTTVSLSCVHWETDRNKEIFGINYGGDGDYTLYDYTEILKSNRFSIRISCVMLNKYIDTLYKVEEFAKKCKEWGVEQFTVRPATFVALDDSKVAQWTKANTIKDSDYKHIVNCFANAAKDDKLNVHLLLELAHGAKVYDYDGQNVSINTCLTESPNPDDIRQLIFFPDGHLRFSWVHKGAIII